MELSLASLQPDLLTEVIEISKREKVFRSLRPTSACVLKKIAFFANYAIMLRGCHCQLLYQTAPEYQKFPFFGLKYCNGIRIKTGLFFSPAVPLKQFVTTCAILKRKSSKTFPILPNDILPS